MTDKNKIIDRLLHKQLITPEEAEILRSKEIEYLPLSPYVQPAQPQFQELFKAKPDLNPFKVDFEKTQNHIKNCPCNPENGGSGICNCTMGTMPVIC